MGFIEIVKAIPAIIGVVRSIFSFVKKMKEKVCVFKRVWCVCLLLSRIEAQIAKRNASNQPTPAI